jgi:hypothetical protein
MDKFASYSHRSTKSAFLGTPSCSGYNNSRGTLYASLLYFGELSREPRTFDTFTTFEDRDWCFLCWTSELCSFENISLHNIVPTSGSFHSMHTNFGLRTSYSYLLAAMEYVKFSISLCLFFFANDRSCSLFLKYRLTLQIRKELQTRKREDVQFPTALAMQ